MTADSATVVYRGDMVVNRQYDLFAVDIDGADHRRLNPALRRTGDVRPRFVGTADGSSVAYLADWTSQWGDDVFVVTLADDSVRRTSGLDLESDAFDEPRPVGAAAFAYRGSIPGRDGSHLFLVPAEPT